jgi:LuxR family transcriptional regulator, activator of tox operons
MNRSRVSVLTKPAECICVSAMAPAIQSLGEADFPRLFGETLASIIPVNLFSIFRLDERHCLHFVSAGGQLGDDQEYAQVASARYAGGYWKYDPMMRKVLEGDLHVETMIRTQAWDAIPPSEYRAFCYERSRVQERVLICRRVGSEIVLVGLYHTQNDRPFSAMEFDKLEANAPVLTSIAWKHAKLVSSQASAYLHPCEDVIAKRLAGAKNKLSTREIEVCSGILIGRSTKEIARVIGIMPSSVVTFRKRAFLKLNITTRQDLVRYYERTLDS